MRDEDKLRSRELAYSLRVSRNTIHIWSNWFQEFLSPGAAPPKGQLREYSRGDLKLLAAIAHYRRVQDLTYHQIGAKLEAGDHEKDDIPIPAVPPRETDRKTPYKKKRCVFSRAQYKRLKRRLDTLDERPDTWAVFGEEIRDSVSHLWYSLCVTRRNRRLLLGRSGESRRTTSYRPHLQEKVKQQRFHRLGKCEECNTRLVGGPGWAIARLDHIVPVVDGGETTHENTRLLCANCHALMHHQNGAVLRAAKAERHTEALKTARDAERRELLGPPTSDAPDEDEDSRD